MAVWSHSTATAYNNCVLSCVIAVCIEQCASEAAVFSSRTQASLIKACTGPTSLGVDWCQCHVYFATT